MPPGQVLLDIMNETRTVLKGIDNTGGTPLFGASPNERLPIQGEELDTTVLPVAAVSWRDELADELDNKISHRLPFDIDVYFDAAVDGTSHAQRHTLIMGRVKDAFMNNRKLNGKVTDTSYIGGGSALDPVDTEQAPDRWKFTLRFESTYRHTLTDSGVAA